VKEIYHLPFTTYRLAVKFMIKKALFLTFGGGIILFYLFSFSLGWEFANSGSRSRFGMPFIYTGFRGGK
jgi:hypothetical protein